MLHIDIILLLTTTLWCMGLIVASEDGYFLSFLKWPFLKWDWAIFIGKPIILCPRCMASVHGTIAYFCNYYDDYMWTNHLIFCVALCFVNAIVFEIYEKIKFL